MKTQLSKSALGIALFVATTALSMGQTTLVDWDFGSLVNSGVPNGPISVPILNPGSANVQSGFVCTGLTGESRLPSFQGLRWASTNPAPGELNVRYFDGDASDSAGTANDGINDNYLSFVLTTAGQPINVTRISISAWRNGSGAPGAYAVETVVDGGIPNQFGSTLLDSNTGDWGFDWFHFDQQVTAQASLEVRFRPVAAPGGQGTGNLHINGLKVESGSPPPSSGGQHNVVFLIADDLTANALRCYGNDEVLTPNIDSLAARGMVFDRAYCQYPVCNAARASLNTGWYTERIRGQGGSFGNFDGALGSNSTLPEHFRDNGYTTARVSKIYHMRVPGDITNGVAGSDHAPSWDSTYNVQAPEWSTPGLAGHYTNENLIFDINQHYNLGFGAAFYAVESSTTGEEQADYVAADQAIEMLSRLKTGPFFLAVGFVRPHVPLVAPAASFSLYDPNQLTLASSVPGDLADIPAQGIFWNELGRGPFNDAARRKVLQAYYASVSFMDDQVGRIIKELRRLDLMDNTIIVFTSDHGYHLGEHTMWQKLSLHEESARVPMIICSPDGFRGRSQAMVESLDLYPTLADASGLAVPDHCQGVSLEPILKGLARSVREAAYTSVSNGQLLRTTRWAYMQYSSGGEELYDMVADPHQFTNLAADPAHQLVMVEMRSAMRQKQVFVLGK